MTNISPGPNDVVFTQYLLPDGKKRMTWITVEPEIKRLATQLTLAGFKFESEMLRNGKVHLDCCNDDEQLASFESENDESVPSQVVDLIRRAHERWLQKQSEEDDVEPPELD